MTPLPSHLAKLARLRSDLADRVLERAALIVDGCPGTSWHDADARAYLEEASDQRGLPGVGT